jgi:SAM-dependent methyltransferase
VERYTPQDYWRRLHRESHNEAGVGYPSLPVSVNRAMYAALTDQTHRMLAQHGLVGAPGRVLDAGSGTGIWVDFWQRAGAQEVVGLDISEDAVAALRRSHPGVRFEVADLGADALPVEGPFDVVSAMSVLLHIVDPERWRRALRNLAGVLRPGGHLVLIEPLVVHAWHGEPFDETSNSRARHLDEYGPALREAGFEHVDRRPATVLLSNVIDTRSRWTHAAMWQWWGLLHRAVHGRERLGAAAGSVLERLDAPLRRTLPNGPSAKLLLLRRA